MVTLELQNSFSKVVDKLPSDIRQELALSMSYKKVAYVKRKGRVKRDVVTTSLLDGRSRKFPTGLLGHVLNFFDGKGIDYTFNDLRVPPLKSEQSLEFRTDFELRPYQQEALDLIGWDEYKSRSRGVFLHATGSGKTHLAAAVAQFYGLPTLIVVPSVNLLIQFSEKMIEWFGSEWVGVTGADTWEPSFITVATQATLWARKDTPECIALLDSIKVVMVDEVHHVSGDTKTGNTWYQIVSQCSNAYFKFGFTGTVPSSDEELGAWLHLKGSTGAIIHEVKPSKLIKLGYSPSISIKLVKIDHGPCNWNNWQAAESHGICGSMPRCKTIVDIANFHSQRDEKVLVITAKVKNHAHVLHDMLNGQSLLMTGTTPLQDRLDMFEEFKGSGTNILIGTVFSEGVDIPEVDVVLLAPGMRSETLVRQRVGRGMRGVGEVLVYDFYDKDDSFLENHSKARLRVYKSEDGFDIDYIGFDEDEIKKLNRLRPRKRKDL